MHKVIREFPLDSSQKGAMTGNGKTGALLWGKDNVLNITLGCADLWDHRGGFEWTAEQNFEAVCDALKRKDADGIKAMFAYGKSRPSIIPVGRIVVTLPEKCELLRYEQILVTGETRIIYSAGGMEKSLSFYSGMDMKSVFSCRGIDEDVALTLVPAWKLFRGKDYTNFFPSMRNSFEEMGFEPVCEYEFTDGCGFIQKLPADPSCSVLLKRNGGDFTVVFQRGITDEIELARTPVPEYITARRASKRFWKKYWSDTPEISHDDPVIEELYRHGLFKYGIMTNPEGVTPGLQGPWIEDHHLPPWSGDYHFNINVQMINMPGLAAGKFANLKKLFEMVLSWREILRYNAKCFVGISDGYMLPHAVDDRCKCMGAFWSGTIDHACSAWVAMMMFDYCDRSGDFEFLRSDVYDFMQGTMNVFKKMLSYDSSGNLMLPVSISPEFRGSLIDAWGKNSSFQLAAIHRLNRDMVRAAEILGVEADPFCREIAEKLPEVTLEDGEIALWDGLLLNESHRHHSHLGALCPFDIIDPESGKWRDIIDKSLYRWVQNGMGQWTGWCTAWASQIYTRVGNGNMANMLLNIWNMYFANEGGGSMHDGCFSGFTIFSNFRQEMEVMQIDGAMGVICAVQDQFVHSQDGVIRAFYGTPPRGRKLKFTNMVMPGGFRISGSRVFTKYTTLNVKASRDGVLRIKLPESEIFEKKMAAGSEIDLYYENGRLVEKKSGCILYY